MKSARGSSVDAARIRGNAVPMLTPDAGAPVIVLLIGEAPGPRGADKSGVPFFGDAAGRHLYRALERIGAITLPTGIDDMSWDGAIFAAAGLRPVAHGVALGNAFDRCPTDNGQTFRAPLRAELEGIGNVRRLNNEIELLVARGLLGIVTLGRVATRTLDVVLAATPRPKVLRRAVAHPSAQGLLSMAPDRGKGARMSDLQDAWMTRCQHAVIECGYPAGGGVDV